MRGRRTNLRHWHDFYKPEASRDLPSGPSDFAHWVGERIEPGSRVVDVGAGNGRDALWFAEQGHPVTALDAAVNGMRRLRMRAARKRLPVERRMVNFNEVRTPLVVAAELARLPEERHLHARFLLDALSGQARQAFWRFAAVTQRTGGRTFLEFRTSASRGEATTYPAHFRQHLDPDAVVAEIEQYGGTWSSARRVAASPSCARRTPTSAGSSSSGAARDGRHRRARSRPTSVSRSEPSSARCSGSGAGTSASTTCSSWSPRCWCR